MADQKLTDKSALSSFEDADLIHVVDVSDTTSSPQGTSKKTFWSLFKSTLKTYFDTLYGSVSNVSNNSSDISTIKAEQITQDAAIALTATQTGFDPAINWCVFGDSTVNSISSDWVGSALVDILGIDSADITIQADAGDKISDQLAVLDALLAGDANYMQGFEYCSLSVGVNDFSQSQLLGEMSDTAASLTVIGYFKDFIEKIYTSNPEIKFYITTPLQFESTVFGWYGVNYKFYTLSDLANAISKICGQYSVSCIDLFNTSGFNELTGSTLSNDVNPLHPNSIGKVIVGREFARGVVGGSNFGNMHPYTDKFASPFTVVQGTNSTPTIVRIENSDTSLLVNEFLGQFQFISNDANPGAGTPAGSVRCVLEDAGFWYGLAFYPRGTSGEFEAMRIDHSGFVHVKRLNNEAQLIVERIGTAPSQFYTKVSQGVIFNYTNGATGYIWQIESVEKMSLTEAGILTVKNDIIAEGVFRTSGYTVATLPAGSQGDRAFVTDATTPTYLGALVGGGAIVCPVFYNGSAWVSS